MYRGDGEISEETSDEVERPLTLWLKGALALDLGLIFAKASSAGLTNLHNQECF